MDAFYPPPPPDVPADLARPSKRYRRQAWAAGLGLALFLLLYLGLIGWLGRFVWSQLTALTHGHHGLRSIVLATPAAFLLLLLVRGLFGLKTTMDPNLDEIQREQHPDLFAFVERVAADAGAPRPARIFLSPRVNAAVFFDPTPRNMVLPSKKNLEIGLALVNALTLDEFKAVISHEFGHFAQQSMSVSSWVYTSRRIVGDMVVGRGRLDHFLDQISRIDIRIAWVGWGMRLLVWALRAVLDTAFRLVLMLERSLSREMELQADLVAASLTGSDSPVHALHRLGAAEDAWNKALNFTSVTGAPGRPVADVFAVQTRILERLREVLGDPTHGQPPPVPTTEPAGHRVFQPGLGSAPRMYATHPPNDLREENLKRRYLPSVRDERPAWILFRDPQKLREQVTYRLRKAMGEDKPAAAVPIERSFEELDRRFERPCLDRRYRGAWLNRTITRDALNPEDLWRPTPTLDAAAAIRALDELYPASLAEILEEAGRLEGERAELEALREGVLSAPGGVVRYRGEEVRRSALPGLIERVEARLKSTRDAIKAHDHKVRATHVAAARLLGQGWEVYLCGLSRLLHYTEHMCLDLGDARGHVDHVFRVVTADGRVSKAELKRLFVACDEMFRAMTSVWIQRDAVIPAAPVLQRLNASSWKAMLPDRFTLGPPALSELGSGWLSAAMSWVPPLLSPLEALRGATLDTLVAAEATVERSLREGTDPGPAPAPAAIPGVYPRCFTDRPRQKRLDWWDRFLLADGVVAGAARLTVATGVLAPAFLLSGSAMEGAITVHNGLARQAMVEIDGRTVTVSSGRTARLSHTPGPFTVRTTDANGALIETFEAEINSAGDDVVYNVAQASVLVRWVATYGDAAEVPPTFLNNPRWISASADVMFTDPPSQLSGRGRGGQKTVISALDEASAQAQLSKVADPTAREALIAVHLRWDLADAPRLGDWLDEIYPSSAFAGALHARMQAGERSVALSRALTDSLAGSEREAWCAELRAEASQAPDDSGAQYLAWRCHSDGPDADAELASLITRFPQEPWLAMAGVRLREHLGDWRGALDLFEIVAADPTLWSQHRDRFLIDRARLRRVLAPTPGEASLQADRVVSQRLANLLSIEDDRVPADPALSRYNLLQKGQLADALQTEDEEQLAILMRLVGASVGASPEQIAAAAALPLNVEGGLNVHTIWVCLGLALRDGRDLAPLQAAAAEIVDDPAFSPPWSRLEPERLRASPKAWEPLAVGLDPVARGGLRVAGILTLGEEAPELWFHEAEALLFGHERPKLR